MAKFTPRKKPKPVDTNKFLGVNESVGITGLKNGEASYIQNFRITKDYKAQKRNGHHVFINFDTGAVQGSWYGTLDGNTIMIVCHGGNVYEYDMTIDTDTVDIADLITEGTVSIIGTLADLPVDIQWFQSKIYFRNGSDYKEYDGNTYQDPVPYVPTVSLNGPPAGGGTVFEEINLLTGEKIQTFIGDGVATTYVLGESGLDSIDYVKINGVDVVSYTSDLVNGQATSISPIPALEDAVEIKWTKVTAGASDLVTNHKYATDFGVGNDTQVFIWGNPNEKNRVRFSDLLKANYFPANSFITVSSDEFAVTDLKAQYQSLLVFKEQQTHIIRPEPNTNYTTNTGLNPYVFPVYDLNEVVGNIAPKGVRLIENQPVSIDGYSVWRWFSETGVEDERNATIISDRIQLSLQALNLSVAVTFDYQNQKEYWLNVGSNLYIWNYGNNTFYKYTNVDANQFLDVEGQVYFNSDGVVNRFGDTFTADGEVAGNNIHAIMRLGFMDFDALELRKSSRYVWISINPASQTSLDISFPTDRVNEEEATVYTTEYRLMDFNNIDFNNFSFLTNYNPQPKRIKARIKKYTYVQVVCENDSNSETLVILKLLMQAQTQGYSK